MTYKCLIVDDEPPAIKVLVKYISSIEQLDVAGTCNNAFKAIEILGRQQVDLIFLDIEMPQLLGTDFIKTLYHPPKVIFTTAYKEFAVDAFDLDAVDYLLKPVSFERFIKAVNKVLYVENPTQIVPPTVEMGFVYLRSQRKMVKIFLADILYIESFKDYVVIHKEDKTELRIKQSISHMEDILPRNMFIRIHRSFIVSTHKITAFTKYDIEIGKKELPIGRSYNNVIGMLTENNPSIP